MNAYKIFIDQATDAVEVKAFPTKKDAQATGNSGIIISKLDDLTQNPLFTGTILAAIYNEVIVDKSKVIKKFSDRETAVRRVWEVLDGPVDEVKKPEPKEAGAPKEVKPAKAPKAPKGDKPKAERKGTRRAMTLSLAKDKANPYRVGSASHKTFELISEKPNKTYAEYIDLGARSNTINGMLRDGLAKIG